MKMFGFLFQIEKRFRVCAFVLFLREAPIRACIIINFHPCAPLMHEMIDLPTITPHDRYLEKGKMNSVQNQITCAARCNTVE